ncbi:MAG TPA: PspC domain-containing protein, partial [Candidatus Limnocylindria bacterium]
MNDETPTTETTEAPQPGPRPRPLRRSSEDRVLAGVAGGLGRYFGIDPLIFRIGFALTLLFGGFGAVAYGLFWLFVPTDGEPDAGQRFGSRLRRMGFWRGVGVAVLAVVAICGLVAIAASAAFAVAIGWGVATAIVVIVVGAVLVAAAFRGGRARWLIAPALALAIGAST